MADLLLQAMNYRQKGDLAQTKQLLAQALIQDPHNESAWMMMSEVVDDIKLKRTCLQRVLLINPENSAANLALTKLDTSPLGPIERGERYKPVMPPKIVKAPPFTPPFTWTGDDAQFQALGELTYPTLPEVQEQPPEQPTTFDWAAESGEPDKTINRIFEAVSNPDLVAGLPANPVLTWMEGEPNPEAVVDEAEVQLYSDADLQDEAVDVGPGVTPEISTSDLADTPTEAEPSPEPETPTPVQETVPETIEFAEPIELEGPELMLWDNPKAKRDRLVILGSNGIIYANPKQSDVPHIIGLFNEKKMLRDLLGEQAGTIKLDSIRRLSANPERPVVQIKYRQNHRRFTHRLTFAGLEVRDEALDAMQLRLGAGFSRRMWVYSLFRRVVLPLLIIGLILITGWFVISGHGLLEGVAGSDSGTLQLILYNINYYVNLFRPLGLVVIGLVGILICLIWLVVNLTKPTRLIIISPSKSR